jgi:hypothetical protein
MPLGQCRLCLQIQDLLSSHFLPAALWKGARTPGLKNPNPVTVTKRTSQTSSKQMQTYLLCGQCEKRFNENGEREALRWIAPGQGNFPIGDRLNVALPHFSTPAVTRYCGSAVGIRTATLAYFALSILWRAAVHSWHLPDGSGATSRIDLGENEEPIRRYLLGSASFPNDVVVVLTVCTDWVSRNIVTTPSHVSASPYNKYYLQTQGLYFAIMTGSSLPPDIRQLCCASSYNKWIFAANREEQSTNILESLVPTSKPAPNLAPPA